MLAQLATYPAPTLSEPRAYSEALSRQALYFRSSTTSVQRDELRKILGSRFRFFSSDFRIQQSRSRTNTSRLEISMY